MATYQVVPDDYAGWNPTGRNFALIAAAGGLIGLVAWLSLHGHLGTLHPTVASDQLFLTGLVWLGAACFWLMAIAVLGSISLSRRSHGTVDVSPKGISRTLRSRTQFLPWSDIQGLVPMPYGGVTLVSPAGKTDLLIPRFLDDYRACIAEIKTHGVQAIPPSNLRRGRRTSWPDTLLVGAAVFFVSFATGAHQSHRVRVAGFLAAISLLAWLFRRDSARNLYASRWSAVSVLLAISVYMLWRIAHLW